MKQKNPLISLVLSGIILLAGPAANAVPAKISYSGRLIESGKDVTNKTITASFSLYNSATGGTSLWTDSHTSIPVTDGMFTVSLGSQKALPANLFNGSTLWLEVAINNQTMTPRVGLQSMPYAFVAGNATGDITPKSVTINGKTVIDSSGKWVGSSISINEIDPVFTKSAAFGISVAKVSNWDAAFQWGNHKTAGYLKSFTETDPVFTKSAAYNISVAKVSKWDTAYQWGNHSSAGYLKSFSETDPQVGSISTNYLSKWNGSALVTGSVYDNGNVGIGTTSPSYRLDVKGGIRSTASITKTNSSGSARAIMTAVSSGDGFIATYGANGNSNASLGNLSGYSNNGYLNVANSSGTSVCGIYANTSGRGRMDLRNAAGNTRIVSTAHSTDTGIVETYGANGNLNAAMTTLASSANNGFVAVHDSSGALQAGMYVSSSGSGVVFGDTKSFRVPNPDRKGTDIWYASLEGPEAAAYLRGTARLVRGKGMITIPRHFRAVATPKRMTVQVTPLSADSSGLAVIRKSLEGVEVRELNGGTGSYEFDFMITAVRRGHENFKVVRPRIKSAALQAKGPTQSSLGPR